MKNVKNITQTQLSYHIVKQRILKKKFTFIPVISRNTIHTSTPKLISNLVLKVKTSRETKSKSPKSHCEGVRKRPAKKITV